MNGKPLDAVDAAVYEESGINRMVPLREAAEELGYEVKWNAELQAAELNKGAQWTSLRAGKNVYSYNRMAPISLSAAPVIKENGKMYVPLSFFSEILKAEVKTSSAAITIK
ncbi:copper amine oxidase N-terminal domain-containing protein [Paenibacillus sp. P26]|nr:copper amine oxidase N-terminal domain-containing protein [Paenibacillus sp. P26]